MSNWMMIFVFVISSWVIGSLLFHKFLKEFSIYMLLPALALGIGVNSLPLFWIFALELPVWIFNVYLFLSLFSILALRKPFINKLKLNTGIRLSMIVVVLVVISIVLFILISLNQPYGDWDSYAFWNLKGRLFAMNMPVWKDIHCTSLLPQADYPLLLPLSYVWVFLHSGIDNWWWPALISFIFTYATASFIAQIFKHDLPVVITGVTALVLNLGFLHLGAAQYADIPLAFFLLTGLYFVSRAMGSDSRPGFAAGGFLISLALWAKNEGLMYLLFISMAIIIVSIIKNQKSWPRNMAALFGGGAPTYLTLIYFKWLTPAENAILKNGELNFGNLLDPERYYYVIYGVLRELLMFSEGPFHPLALILMVSYVIYVGKARWVKNLAQKFLLVFLSISLGGLFAVYMFTPLSPLEHIQSSASRLILQLFPVFILWLSGAFAFKPPLVK